MVTQPATCQGPHGTAAGGGCGAAQTAGGGAGPAPSRAPHPPAGAPAEDADTHGKAKKDAGRICGG
ncbi:hypothetical protein E2C01_096936 [Portunus trituberculatus]|uniref:Uncharacterized protein n=1 Tax=Portunus trituberculatus TaxID=210409 RepID=A0A5B7K8L7_PORTR|nr:hypothetical protein [Portunus trituberculatus]